MKLFLVLVATAYCSVTYAGSLYVYEDANGKKVLSNSLIKNSKEYKHVETFETSKTVTFNPPTLEEQNIADEKALIESYKDVYVRWVARGKRGDEPHEPEKATTRVVFDPYVKISIKNGSGLIATENFKLDYWYKSHADCIEDQQENLQEFKSTYNFKLTKNIVFPKNTQINYSYFCNSRVSDVYTSLITNKTKSEIKEMLNKLPKDNYDRYPTENVTRLATTEPSNIENY